MKLSLFSNGFKPLSRPSISEAFSALFYSTETPTPSSDKVQRDLYKIIITQMGDPRVSVVPVLDQWIAEGNTVGKGRLLGLIMQLKAYRRFTHALEISHWMSDRRYFVLSPGYIAVRLDLISKVYGIEQVEKYFDNIPRQHKVFQTYVSLLNCYAREKCVEKAEAVMQQMKELGFATSAMAFNAFLNLYFQAGQFEKVDTLIEEMKGMGVSPDMFTLRTQLNTCVATSNIDGMEKVLMELDSNAIIDWSSYAIAAKGYIKAGLIDKALEKLQKVEKIITWKERRTAYGFLLTLYASAGRKEDLYRIWNLCKSSGKVYNASFILMIASLLKFDDIAGAEKILGEWEAGDTCYDFRIPKLLIAAYCKNGLLEKAEMLVNKAIEKGEKPRASTWDILAKAYVGADQIPKAAEAMKAALLASQPGWKPSCDTLETCLVYLKQQGDTEKVDELVRLLGAPGDMTIDDCNKEPQPGEVDEMERNRAADDEEPNVNEAM